MGGGLAGAAGADRATRPRAAAPTASSRRSATSCAGGSGRPSAPPSWPSSTARAPTGACRWRGSRRPGDEDDAQSLADAAFWLLPAGRHRLRRRPPADRLDRPVSATRRRRRPRRPPARRMTIWSASMRTRDLALAGPVLGVDGVVLDRGVEPEAVAVGLAVVEGRLELFAAAAPAAAAATAAPRAAGALAAVALAPRVLAPRRPRPRRSSSGSSSSSASASSAVAASISASISSRRSISLAPASSSSGVRPCCLRNSRSSEALTSSWWAIQASVRPWRTQARIWLSCGFSERRAIGARVY